jgi:hypothetical protein
VLEVSEANLPALLEVMGDEAKVIGTTIPEYALHITTPTGTHTWSGHDLEKAWRGALS